MKIENIYKIILCASVIVFWGGINSLATTDGEVDTHIGSTIDNVAPVFNEDIQKRYVIKKVDDDTVFVPEEVITGIEATDNVDGKDVKIEIVQHNVDLTRDGIYQVLYMATDKTGNSSALCVEVIVDGIAPSFNENIETLYYISHSGIITDSKHNDVNKLPEMITATDAVGAYAGIGVYMADINGNVVFVKKIENTPADKVLEENDILISIDGEDIRGKTSAYAASRIKGKEGTKVTLQIIRDNEEMTVEIERMIVKLYGEQDCIAKPNVDITKIDIKKDGVIEITYTATDEAGNTSTIVVKVVIGETEDEAITEDYKDVEEKEELDDITTGGNPPTDENTEVVDEEKIELIDE